MYAERVRTLAQVAGLGRDFTEMIESSAHASVDDEHDPEGATVAFERAQVDALLTHARGQLAEITAALERLDAGTYGACERCRRMIPPERLAARPTARHCVACAGLLQRQGRLAASPTPVVG